MINRRKFFQVLWQGASGPLFLAGYACFAGKGRARRLESQQGPDLEKRDKTMDFKSVKPGDHIKNPCSPQLPVNVTGIRINVPPRLNLSKDTFLVCGTYYFPAEYVYSFPNIHEAIVLVAVDAFSHKPYCCNLTLPGAIRDLKTPPAPPKDPDWMANHFIERYFNIDLLRFVEGFPMVSSTYYIYALLEKNSSNVCKVVCTA